MNRKSAISEALKSRINQTAHCIAQLSFAAIRADLEQQVREQLAAGVSAEEISRNLAACMPFAAPLKISLRPDAARRG